MKRRSEKSAVSAKALAIASVVGVVAIGAAVFSAYHRTMDRLIPTNNSTSTEDWVFNVSGWDKISEPAESEVSVIKPVTESSEPAPEKDAQEVNKPVTADVGNILPVEGEVSHPFSNGELVKSETLGVWKTHDGVDIRADAGATVKSMSTGTVTEVRDDPMWGVCVVIDHGNGIEGHYYGLDKTVFVKPTDLP